MSEFVRKSQIQSWRICPKLYEYTWVEKHPTQPAVEMQFGTEFHEFARDFFKVVDLKSLMDCRTKDEALRVFALCVRDVTPPVVSPWIFNFLRFEARRWEICKRDYAEPLVYWMPVDTEVEVVSEKYHLLMHIDRIVRIGEKELMNIEYKTNKYWNLADLRFETALYNLGVNDSRRYRLPVLFIGAYNPQLDRCFVEKITARLLQRTYRILLQFENSVDAGEFKYRPQHFCRYCQRLQKCIDENFGGEPNDNPE